MRYTYDQRNWEKTKERLNAWWNGEIIDRCCASVVFIDQNAVGKEDFRKPKNEAERIQYWTDPEWVVRRNRDMMNCSWYGGDAFPLAALNLGAAGHAGFFRNAKYTLTDETVWFHPSVASPEELEFDENSFLFRKTLEVAKALADDSKGEYRISMADCSGNIDVLSHLLGAEELLPLMLEDADSIKMAMKKVETAYERIHREVYDIIKNANDGGSCIGWLRTWAPGFHAQMQSDLSVMISPEMFVDFIEPELRTQSDYLEYALYHFDGVEQVRHLDSLLSIEKLQVIQWTDVFGKTSFLDYIPELQRIQKAGKKLLLLAQPNQIRPIMENLSSKGLYLHLYADSREEGEAMLKEIEHLTHE